MTRIALHLLAAAAAATAAETTDKDPLSAWLYNLQLPLPDAHGTVDGVAPRSVLSSGSSA